MRKKIPITEDLKSMLALATLAIAEKSNSGYENCDVQVERISALKNELRCMESEPEDQTVLQVKTELAYKTQEKLLLV